MHCVGSAQPPDSSWYFHNFKSIHFCCWTWIYYFLGTVFFTMFLNTNFVYYVPEHNSSFGYYTLFIKNIWQKKRQKLLDYTISFKTMLFYNWLTNFPLSSILGRISEGSIEFSAQKLSSLKMLPPILMVLHSHLSIIIPK